MRDELELAAVRTVLVGADGPTTTAWDQAHTALLEAIAQDQASGPKRAGRFVPRRLMPRRERLIPALGGLVLAAAIAALVTEVFMRGGTVQPQPAAAAVLVRAAAAALGSPPARVGPHQYWYQQAQGTYLDTVVSRQGSLSAYVSEVDRWWIGSEHWIRRGRLVRISPAQPITTRWQRELLRQFRASPSISGGGPGFDLPVGYARMLVAPTTTRALAKWVLHADSPPGNPSATPAPKWRVETMMSAIHDILSSRWSPPD